MDEKKDIKKYVTKTGLSVYILSESRNVDIGIVNFISFDNLREIVGAINGMSRTKKKSKASMLNGKKGGRPRKKRGQYGKN